MDNLSYVAVWRRVPILAPNLLDLLWPMFLLLGLERVRVTPSDNPFLNLTFDHYPITHSLVGAIGWGFLLGGIYFALRRDRRGALLLGLLVVSHWFLDWITHVPDLPLWPGGPVTGLGLWSFVPATLAVEALVFAGGLWVYATATTPLDRIGRWAFAGFAAFLVAAYAASILGPPPPDATAIGYGGLAAWLFVPWAAWFDAHREPTVRQRGAPGTP